MSLLSNLLLLLSLIITPTAFSLAKDVEVKPITPGSGPPVIRGQTYTSHVTLYIANDDGSKTWSGWSTRKSDGAEADAPFSFSPGVGLIEGWTEGVLKMVEGERSWLMVPSEKGYGSRELGKETGWTGVYIPANSDLAFDIEILGKEGGEL